MRGSSGATAMKFRPIVNMTKSSAAPTQCRSCMTAPLMPRLRRGFDVGQQPVERQAVELGYQAVHVHDIIRLLTKPPRLPSPPHLAETRTAVGAQTALIETVGGQHD